MPLSKKQKAKRRAYTKEMRATLRRYREETGWGAIALARRVQELRLLGWKNISAGVVMTMLHRDDIKTVDKQHYAAILSAFETLPLDSYNNSSHCKNLKRATLSAEFQDRLVQLLDKTGHISMQRFLKFTNAPDNLKPTTVYRVRKGEQPNLKIEHYQYFLRMFEEFNIS